MSSSFLFSDIYVVLFVLVLFLIVSLKIVFENQRAVVFRLGRFQKVKGPGLITRSADMRIEILATGVRGIRGC